MKTMKYKAETEREAMLMAKNELGSEALILSIKSVTPKGLWKFIRKPYVEVVAAVDDGVYSVKNVKNLKNKEEKNDLQGNNELAAFKLFLSRFSEKQRKAEENIEKEETAVLKSDKNTKLSLRKESTTQSQLMEKKNNQMENNNELEINSRNKQIIESIHNSDRGVEKNNAENDQQDHSIVDSEAAIGQVIYEQLLDNEVEPQLADQLLKNLLTGQDHFSFDQGLNNVYRQIVKELSNLQPISLSLGKAKPIFFIGSTGVGKTTTIAKLASKFTIEKKCKVGLITADTYRIAAVEQLRTYANILNIPIKVIYNEEEIIEGIEEFSDMDLIFIDTAGRSYQDKEHLEELKNLLDQVDEKQVYLVLSLSTKNSDLQKTVEAYNFADFSLIFSKLDETLAYGSILNLVHKTKKPLSYVTTGQNVPEDIAELDSYEIANQILGGVDN